MHFVGYIISCSLIPAEAFGTFDWYCPERAPAPAVQLKVSCISGTGVRMGSTSSTETHHVLRCHLAGKPGGNLVSSMKQDGKALHSSTQQFIICLTTKTTPFWTRQP
ncbi:hypothetical protein PR001_g34136 [Phytophthora rubi]|uniref:Secreted protein n=1 Tax=Phytophthora rubi TaxID=129364 RepID=A0A6A3G194_9STRA|nr:hypothetical protein PR001_g34136 [Phytophthora rubi]KAE8950490.1 hypothetical protein PR002_g33257 [Phytophthora rubi]